MLSWDSISESEWDNALAIYHCTLDTREKRSRDARVTIINAYVLRTFNPNEFYHFLLNEFLVWKHLDKRRLASTQNKLCSMTLNSLAIIQQELVNQALNDKELLNVALKIPGIGYSGATALLSILYPNRFGTVDKHVIISLKSAKSMQNDAIIQSINPDHFTKKQTLYVINKMQQKAKILNYTFQKNSWTPRAVDKAIWADRKS